jgi:hypothetical protein
MLGLVMTASPAAADETVLAPTAFNVDGGSVTTPALVAGSTYRLDVGGTFQEVGPNITFDHDAAYCFSDNATIPICKGDPSLSQTALFAGYGGSNMSPFYELAGPPPPYAESHRYALTFTAGQSAPLEFRANTPELNRDYPGQLAVAVYRVTTPPNTCPRSAVAFTSQCAGGAATPLTHVPKSGETVSYAKPAPGDVAVANGPPIPKNADKAIIRIKDPQTFVVAADVINSACFFAYLESDFRDIFHGKPSAFEQCKKVMNDVLFRCAQLKVQRGGPGLCGGPGTTGRAAAGCPHATVSPGKAKARLSCQRTADGIQLSLTPRKGRSLRKAIGKRPKFVFGAAIGGSLPERLEVTWQIS